MSTNRRTRAPREIEADLDGNRARLSDTLDKLQNKLSPRELFDQAFNYARAKGGGDEFTSNIKQTVARNPLPAALIGLGLAWLTMAGRRGSVPDDSSSQIQGYEQEPPGDMPADVQVAGRETSSDEMTVADEANPASDKAGFNVYGGDSASVLEPSDEVAKSRDQSGSVGDSIGLKTRGGDSNTLGARNKTAESSDKADPGSDPTGRKTIIRDT
jgi:hypothetical protein